MRQKMAYPLQRYIVQQTIHPPCRRLFNQAEANIFGAQPR